ncbi:acyl-[acyl-carrier-protein] thioesterase [Flammeovirga aprica]|uniref:Acyl-[acyl-carrier-protein] thioesterase n=1 Tax=Flammeovirga aprica JL-4 TaxID=694437 RepID=A0A7X9RUJ2_9BACT|nr:acyl-ACP thioesterase domain-containing protein [Flammeovirga aprica]NME68975.1 hypothetical protein [Flammeovirga aprica JL-4]
MNKEIEGIWYEEQVVKSYQIGPNYTLKPTAISELFQEAAGNHSNAKKFGLRELMKVGKAWVLGTYKYEVFHWPKWTDQLSIETWVYDVQKFSSQRNFKILDEEGKLMIYGSSNWFGLDLKKRRPTSINEFEDCVHVREDLTTVGPPKRLKGVEKVDFSSEREASYSDLDPVNHVNNIRYFEWMLDSLPVEITQKKTLKAVEINYVAEVILGEKVKIVHEVLEEEDTKIISAIMKENKPACIIHSVWK